jgi:hypothetical protein
MLNIKYSKIHGIHQLRITLQITKKFTETHDEPKIKGPHP